MSFFRTFKNVTLNMIALANIIVVAVMCFCAYIGHVSPERFPLGEVIALAFPIPLLINLLFLIFWLLSRFRYALIPVVGMLICSYAIWDYCPVHFRQEVPQDAIKVMSYNVCNYTGVVHNDRVANSEHAHKVADYIRDSKCDIVCVQEAGALRPSLKREIIKILAEEYPYYERQRKKGGEEVSVFSHYPILWSKELPIDQHKNQSAVFCLDVDGTEVLVYNCHFQSIGFTKDDKDDLKNLIERKTNTLDERSLISKMKHSAPIRAKQADYLANELKLNEGKPIILCGDFNCSPTCYAHTKICRLLTDCFKASGLGWSFSYNNGETYARIDNIFCSKDFVPSNCHVDKKIDVSDHYPVVCWIKKAPKP